MKNKFLNYIDNTTKNKTLMAFLALALCIYLPSLYFDFFVFDDNDNILTNSKLDSFGDLISKWETTKIPLSYNYWQIVGALFGNETATPYRFFNIFFHCINGLLIYEIAQKALRKNKMATLISGLFLIHPIGVQSVIWVSSSREVLATLFTLISVNLFLHNSHKKKYLFLSFIFWICSILFKPISLILPLLIPLFYSGKKIKTFIGFCFISILVFVFLYISEMSKFTSSDHYPFTNYFGSYVITTITYLKNYLFPFFLEFNYSMTPSILNEIITSFKFLYYLVAFLIILVSVKFLKNKLYLYAMVVFLLLISINSGLIPFSHQAISTVTDRYLYFPSIALAFIISSLLLSIKKEKQKYLVATVSLILTFVSFSEVNKWRTSSARLYQEHSDNHIQKISYANALIWDKKYAETFSYIDNNFQPNDTDNTTHILDYLSVRLALFSSLPRGIDYNTLKSELNNNLDHMQPDLYPLIANFAFKNQDFNLARKAYIHTMRSKLVFLIDFDIETLDNFQEIYEDRVMTEATLIPSRRNADHVSKKLYNTLRPFIADKLQYDNVFKKRN